MSRDDPSTLELSAMVQRIAERSYNACREWDLRSQRIRRASALPAIIENTIPKRPTSANRSTNKRHSTIGRSVSQTG
jgi:hypothetical protein